jgi:hypothetical protein
MLGLIPVMLKHISILMVFFLKQQVEIKALLVLRVHKVVCQFLHRGG